MSYLPDSGNISLTSIRSIMNGGNSLSSYRNAYFFTAANAFGRLPSSTIRFSDFRSKGKRANVAAGQFTMLGNTSTTIGVVNTLAIDIAGAGGGGAGVNGNYGAAGAAGGNGGSTTFTSPIGTLTGPGGGGAPSQSVNGADGAGAADGYPDGGLSGNGVNRGGTGGRYTPRIVLNAATDFDAIAAWFGRTVTANCGVGGGGGIGAENFVFINGNFFPTGRSASGNKGTDGVVAIYWT